MAIETRLKMFQAQLLKQLHDLRISTYDATLSILGRIAYISALQKLAETGDLETARSLNATSFEVEC